MEHRCVCVCVTSRCLKWQAGWGGGMRSLRFFPRETPSSLLGISSDLHSTRKRIKSLLQEKQGQLLPLFVLLGVTVSGSLMFLFRVGARNPDYTWNKKENPEPWNKLPPTYQYKMVTLHTDYSKLKKDRPDF